MKTDKRITTKYLGQVANTYHFIKNVYGDDIKCIKQESLEKVCLIAIVNKECFLWNKYGNYIPKQNLQIKVQERLNDLLIEFDLALINNGDHSDVLPKTYLQREMCKICNVVCPETTSIFYVSEQHALEVIEMESTYKEYNWMNKYYLYLPDGIEELEVISKKMKKAVAGKVGCKFKFNHTKKAQLL